MNFINETKFLQKTTGALEKSLLVRQDFIVRSNECDYRGRVHFSSIFSYFEEIAQTQVEVLGMNDDLKKDKSLVWILNRIHLKINDLPKWKDEIKLYTWQSKQNRIGFFREFYLFDKAGKALVAAKSFWTLMDINKRKLASPTTVFPNENYYILKIHAVDETLNNLRNNFANFEHNSTRKINYLVSYSDIDANKHMHNTKYVSLIRDAIDLQDLGDEIVSIQLNYSAEIYKGDLLEIRSTLLPYKTNLASSEMAEIKKTTEASKKSQDKNQNIAEDILTVAVDAKVINNIYGKEFKQDNISFRSLVKIRKQK